MDIVDILNTGVTGFAFLMLYLGYKLTSDVQTRILDKNTNDFSTIEMFQEWKDLVCTQLINTRYFMMFAIVFFAGGLFLLLFNAENKIIIAVSPIEEGIEPVIRHQSSTLELSKDGSTEVLVRNEHNIVISNDTIIKELNRLRLSNKQKQEIARRLVTTDASTSSEAGFGL